MMRLYSFYMVCPIIFINSDHILELNMFNSFLNFSCNLLCFRAYSNMFEKFNLCFYVVVVVVVVVVADTAVCCCVHPQCSVLILQLLSYYRICVFLFTLYFSMYLIRFADIYL